VLADQGDAPRRAAEQLLVQRGTPRVESTGATARLTPSRVRRTGGIVRAGLDNHRTVKVLLAAVIVGLVRGLWSFRKRTDRRYRAPRVIVFTWRAELVNESRGRPSLPRASPCRRSVVCRACCDGDVLHPRVGVGCRGLPRHRDGHPYRIPPAAARRRRVPSDIASVYEFDRLPAGRRNRAARDAMGTPRLRRLSTRCQGRQDRLADDWIGTLAPHRDRPFRPTVTSHVGSRTPWWQQLAAARAGVGYRLHVHLTWMLGLYGRPSGVTCPYVAPR
jgi:hypothetical protein